MSWREKNIKTEEQGGEVEVEAGNSKSEVRECLCSCAENISRLSILQCYVVRVLVEEYATADNAEVGKTNTAKEAAIAETILQSSFG
ncbi:hypothetical protein J6590_031881 [Homalodisca vitripennis]|nr:hypothetical protein J6590_031881 [Homalodisca vitripennis]